MTTYNYSGWSPRCPWCGSKGRHRRSCPCYKYSMRGRDE